MFSVKVKSTQTRIGYLFFFLIITQGVVAQVPAFDRMEMLFFQKHYKIVYRKANRLLDKPEYDFSKFPIYYRSISAIELAQNQIWFKKNETLLIQAIEDLISIKKTEGGKRIFEAHIEELSIVKADLDAWLTDLKRQGRLAEYSDYAERFSKLFSGVKILDLKEKKMDVVTSVSDASLNSRFEIVKFAQKQLGVPYVSAGDNPTGFDCSGFTCYVLTAHGKSIPRRAKDQYEASNKLRASEAKMGDLVFFSNGGDISHVGMLINEPGKPKAMIHASSSKGISIIEIESSEYWNKRVVGYGTFIR